MFTTGLKKLTLNNTKVRIALIVIIIFHLFLLSKLVFFPYPELFIYSYLTDQGLIPYKQIFDQHFPGVMFFPINLATLGIDTPIETRILHSGIVVLIHFLLFRVSKKLFGSNFYCLISNFLFLVWQPFFEGYVLWIDTFVPLLLLPGFYFLQDRTKRNLFLAGLFLGLALLLKQVVGPLIVFVGLYLWLSTKSVKNAIYYAFGVFIPVSLLLLWVAKLNIWSEFLYWTVTFNLTTFSEMGRKYPDVVGVIKALPLFGVALFSLIIRNKDGFKKIFVIWIFLIGSLLFAFARFDYIHLQPAIPFAILLCVYLLSKVNSHKMAIITAYFFLLFPLFFLFYKANLGSNVLFFGSHEEIISQKVLKYTSLHQKVFAFGTTPHLYQLTKTLPPGEVFVFQFPWFMVVAEDKIFNGLVEDFPELVVRDKTSTTSKMGLVAYMPKIESYIDRYYEVIDLVGGVEIMRKKSQ